MSVLQLLIFKSHWAYDMEVAEQGRETCLRRLNLDHPPWLGITW
jgi:hypothetical protein